MNNGHDTNHMPIRIELLLRLEVVRLRCDACKQNDRNQVIRLRASLNSRSWVVVKLSIFI